MWTNRKGTTILNDKADDKEVTFICQQCGKTVTKAIPDYAVRSARYKSLVKFCSKYCCNRAGKKAYSRRLFDRELALLKANNMTSESGTKIILFEPGKIIFECQDCHAPTTYTWKLEKGQGWHNVLHKTLVCKDCYKRRQCVYRCQRLHLAMGWTHLIPKERIISQDADNITLTCINCNKPYVQPIHVHHPHMKHCPECYEKYAALRNQFKRTVYHDNEYISDVPEALMKKAWENPVGTTIIDLTTDYVMYICQYCGRITKHPFPDYITDSGVWKSAEKVKFCSKNCAFKTNTELRIVGEYDDEE